MFSQPCPAWARGLRDPRGEKEWIDMVWAASWCCWQSWITFFHILESVETIHWSTDGQPKNTPLPYDPMVVSQCTKTRSKKNKFGFSMQLIVSRRGSPANHSPFNNLYPPTECLEIKDFWFGWTVKYQLVSPTWWFILLRRHILGFLNEGTQQWMVYKGKSY